MRSEEKKNPFTLPVGNRTPVVHLVAESLYLEDTKMDLPETGPQGYRCEGGGLNSGRAASEEGLCSMDLGN